MAIINQELLSVNINKMKFYNREQQLNADVLKNLINSNNNMYTSSNLNTIKNFEANLLSNLKTINTNHAKYITVFEKNINKYLTLEQQTALKFSDLGVKK